MSYSTKYGVIVGEKQAEVHEKALDEPGKDEVLVDMKACNICTTDYQLWSGSRDRPLPEAGGHESAGIVKETGPGVRGLKKGDHVATGYFSCGECQPCRNGENLIFCENNPSEGSSQSQPDKADYDEDRGTFGYANYRKDDKSRFYKIADDLPFAQGAFLEPVATVVEGIKLLGVAPGDRSLIIGGGTMGLINAQVARVFGAQVLVSELLQEKREVAESMGFPTVNPAKEGFSEKVEEFVQPGKLASIVMAVGNTEAYENAFEVASISSKILFFAAGYPEPEMDIDPNQIHYNIWELIGTYGANSRSFMQASRFLSERLINVEPLLESSYKLEDIQQAYQEATVKGKYRVSVDLD